MCGIIGILGKTDVADRILDGLKRLEYRGYDSAGIATLVNGHIDRRRAEGKLSALGELLAARPLPGDAGIGHTRWATHGAPTEANAHPHATTKLAIVHNGIIENFQELRDELERGGARFTSETDTEVVAQLITRHLEEGMGPKDATFAALNRLHGAFAFAIVFAGEHDLMIGARRGSPLAVGYGEGEMYLGSDALALAGLTNRIAYLDEGDWAVLDRRGAAIYDAEGRPAERPIRTTSLSAAMTGKGEYRHFMLKEIYEQPTVIGETLKSFIGAQGSSVALPPLPFGFSKLSRLTIVACGTAYYA
ncbi:MAG TPA: glutamine--fructose-6-phosphate aminotransferase, partial [Alphaproteobacteria bacterium]|nr:glutamine--fructose-6-phosphate aminotransferase [Alphaproteobacteria bacterium]